MRIAQSVAEVLRQHMTLEVESIDRMYLNVYVPCLQILEGVLALRQKRGTYHKSRVIHICER
jgi:hypothetical protein